MVILSFDFEVLHGLEEIWSVKHFYTKG